MAAISRANELKQLLPGLNALFGDEYNNYENEHEMIYESENSDRSFEEELKLSRFGAAPVKDEGASVSYDVAQESFVARSRSCSILCGRWHYQGIDELHRAFHVLKVLLNYLLFLVISLYLLINNYDLYIQPTKNFSSNLSFNPSPTLPTTYPPILWLLSN